MLRGCANTLSPGLPAPPGGGSVKCQQVGSRSAPAAIRKVAAGQLTQQTFASGVPDQCAPRSGSCLHMAASSLRRGPLHDLIKPESSPKVPSPNKVSHCGLGLPHRNWGTQTCRPHGEYERLWDSSHAVRWGHSPCRAVRDVHGWGQGPGGNSSLPGAHCVTAGRAATISGRDWTASVGTAISSAECSLRLKAKGLVS